MGVEGGGSFKGHSLLEASLQVTFTHTWNHFPTINKEKVKIFFQPSTRVSTLNVK